MTHDLLLARVRKLLAMTTDRGATEHEMATALSFAQTLLAKHNLTMDAVTRVEAQLAADFVHRSESVPQRERAWRSVVGNAIAKYGYASFVLDGSRGWFVGTAENVGACRQLYRWTVAQLILLARFEAPVLATYGWRPSFLRGAALRIAKRLADAYDDLDRETDGAAYALAIRHEVRHDAHIRQHLGRTTVRKIGVSGGSGLADGWRAGAKVDLALSRSLPAPPLALPSNG